MSTAVETVGAPPFPSSLAARVNRRNVVALSMGLLAAAGVGDLVTGVDVTFTLLYVLPVALGTWFRGRRFGVALSLGAAASGTLTSVASSDHHLAPAAIVWNQSGALGVFLAIVWLLDRVRALVEREQRERTIAVSQLRHAERLNVIGTLAAGVAHELGTPLNVITGHAELLSSGSATPEKVHRSSQVILEQANRMAEIVSHLLDFGRRGGSARTTADLGALVARAASLLQHTAARAGCEIVNEAPLDVVKVRVNVGEIEQVLANLLLNAIQAMPNGGTVRLGCELEDVTDLHGVRRSFACLSVEDQGEGIHPSDLPKIFDPFFTTKGVGKGTGLGLSVTYGIVQDHGGVIHVSSAVGHGTRFVVRFPITD